MTDANLIFAATFAFVFVALSVGGFRAIDIVRKRRAADAEAASRRADALARATDYRGRTFGRWER